MRQEQEEGDDNAGQSQDEDEDNEYDEEQDDEEEDEEEEEEISEVSDPTAGGVLEEAVGEGWEECDDCHDMHYVNDDDLFAGLDDENINNEDIEKYMKPFEGEPAWMDVVREALNEPIGKGLDDVGQEEKDFLVENYHYLAPGFQELVRESGLAPDQTGEADDHEVMSMEGEEGDQELHHDDADDDQIEGHHGDQVPVAPSLRADSADGGRGRGRGTRPAWGAQYGAGRHESRSMHLAPTPSQVIHVCMLLLCVRCSRLFIPVCPQPCVSVC